MIKPNHKSSAGSSPNFTHHHHPSLMPQGKPISEDIQWIVVRLGAAFSSDDVAMYTNISEHKVRAITRGLVVSMPPSTGGLTYITNFQKKISRYAYLTMLSSLHQITLPQSTSMALLVACQMYTDELQQELKEKHGVSVATSTIWRALVRGGYSMKKVCSKLIDWAIMSDRL